MWLKPIRLVVTLALVILTAPLAVDAQPPTKVYRIGLLTKDLEGSTLCRHPQVIRLEARQSG